MHFFAEKCFFLLKNEEIFACVRKKSYLCIVNLRTNKFNLYINLFKTQKMKKFFSLFAAVVAAMAINATTVTFDFTNEANFAGWGVTAPAASAGFNLDGMTITTGNVSIAFDKSTNNTSPRIWNASGNYELRAYGSNKLTFSVTGTDKINAINFGQAIALEGTTEAKTEFTFPAGVQTVTFVGTATIKIKQIVVTLNESVVEWTPDTLTVTEARNLITNNDPLANKTHYIKGVVSSNSFGKQWPGYANIWMHDIVNTTDTLEAYQTYKGEARAKFEDETDVNLAIGDTIMVFADGLTKYNTIFETTSGYFVELLGAGPNHGAIATIDTLTVAEAMTLGNSLADNAESEKVVVVGYMAKEKTAYSAQYGNQSIYLSDDPNATFGDFYAFQCSIEAPGAVVGDKVAVTGKIVKYVGQSGNATIEISKGSMEILEHATAIDNIEDSVKATKIIENGQIVIIRNGIRFNAAGARL